MFDTSSWRQDYRIRYTHKLQLNLLIW
uniref:Uncharacterized protein n=1 Tax=Anguilla anguilla TaxID=7936 RepID=A0A0E9PD17_ANGAN